jgi:hypothetical protein
MPRLTVDTSRLAPLPRDFLSRLDALLDELRPALLDAAMTKASAREDGVEVVLAHATVIAYSVWAQAARDVIVVGCSATQTEHASAGEALEAVGALLRGEREVRGYDGVVLRPRFVA